MKIPILDLKPETEGLWGELTAAIEEILKSGQFILGPKVAAFEKEIAAYLGTKHAIGVNSGTDALVIGLRAAGIAPGDEVITSAFTFFATAEAISLVGATPVFVDIDPRTFNLDPQEVAQAVTPRTKGLLPVHLYGQAANMEPLMELAEKHHLKVIEDTAQAFGGDYQGKKLGTIGHVGCFSFYPTKILGAYGDGGLIVTDDDEIAETARTLRAHGAKQNYYNETIGYNSRLDALQAAILSVKLPYIDQWISGRREAAQYYNELLKDTPEIVLPYEAPYTKHVYNQYTIRVSNGKREQLHRQLQAAGIGTMIYYPVPLHKLPVYAGTTPRLRVAEQYAQEVLSLPIWPQMEKELQETVAEKIKEILTAE
ncbi:MAG: DegT/DnrJ/EryC1/StrS family aminotransferase [Firmicutes bacterium]|nr:DegT/DnrJ/EryC1/StrS family aminotransferase [Bacillota bacterium]